MSPIETILTTAHDAQRAASAASPESRANWLEAIAEALEASRTELVDLALQETHLPEARLDGELTRTAFQLRLLAGWTRTGEPEQIRIDHADPEWGMGPRPDLRSHRVPLGVVAVFGASNFPFAFSVAGGDTAAALAGGNAVVHKIHEAHLDLGRRTAQIVVEALGAAGAPRGLFAGIGDPERGRELGEALVDHPLVRAVGFTGSVPAGRALADRCAARPDPIPFFGELGSINPVVVTHRAWAERPEEIARGYAGSLTLGTGQFCTNPGLLLVLDEDADDITAAITTALAEASAPSRMLTPGIHAVYLRARDRVTRTRGVSVPAAGDDLDPPAPTLLRARAEDLEPEALETEMFGPAGLLVSCRDEAELRELIARLPGQLTGTIHAGAAEPTGEITTALSERVGRVIRDGWPTGVTVSHAQHHGGPYPAATLPGTSVGTGAIERFTRTVAYQDFPQEELPAVLRDAAPAGISRLVDGVRQSGASS